MDTKKEIQEQIEFYIRRRENIDVARNHIRAAYAADVEDSKRQRADVNRMLAELRERRDLL